MNTSKLLFLVLFVHSAHGFLSLFVGAFVTLGAAFLSSRGGGSRPSAGGGAHLDEEIEKLKEDLARTQNSFAQTQKERDDLQEIVNRLEEAEAKRKEHERLLQEYPPFPFQMTAEWAKWVNIAVTGSRGVGKSTFINTSRRMYSKDAGAAPVCHGVECTMEPTPYIINGTPVRLWDLPGMFTPNHPKETYFKNMGLHWFDAVVIMSDEFFSEGDLAAMNDCIKNDVQFVMARNKVNTLQERVENEGDSVEDALEDVRREMRQYGVNEVYFISAFLKHRDQWDFPALMTKLEEIASVRIEK